MRLRKYLDACHAKGVEDGASGRLRSPSKNPGPVACIPLTGELSPYGRWAYDAGYTEGRDSLKRLAAALQGVGEHP